MVGGGVLGLFTRLNFLPQGWCVALWVGAGPSHFSPFWLRLVWWQLGGGTRHSAVALRRHSVILWVVSGPVGQCWWGVRGGQGCGMPIPKTTPLCACPLIVTGGQPPFWLPFLQYPLEIPGCRCRWQRWPLYPCLFLFLCLSSSWLSYLNSLWAHLPRSTIPLKYPSDVPIYWQWSSLGFP